MIVHDANTLLIEKINCSEFWYVLITHSNFYSSFGEILIMRII